MDKDQSNNRRLLVFLTTDEMNWRIFKNKAYVVYLD